MAKLEASVGDGLVSGAYLTVFPKGRLVKLKLPGRRHFRIAGKRGEVEGLSDDAKKRMMERCHAMERGKADHPAFVTLTFPDEAIPSPQEAKHAVQILFKRWRRNHPSRSGMWVMENHPDRSQRIGKDCPHFHLVVWGGWVDREELSQDWAESVETAMECPQEVFWKCHRAGTKVESSRSFHGVTSYISAYLAKGGAPFVGKTGRMWGIFNSRSLPMAAPVRIQLNIRQVRSAIRFARRFMIERGVIDVTFPWSSYFTEAPSAIWKTIVGGTG